VLRLLPAGAKRVGRQTTRPPVHPAMLSAAKGDVQSTPPSRMRARYAPAYAERHVVVCFVHTRAYTSALPNRAQTRRILKWASGHANVLHRLPSSTAGSVCCGFQQVRRRVCPCARAPFCFGVIPGARRRYGTRSFHNARRRRNAARAILLLPPCPSFHARPPSSPGRLCVKFKPPQRHGAVRASQAVAIWSPATLWRRWQATRGWYWRSEKRY